MLRRSTALDRSHRGRVYFMVSGLAAIAVLSGWLLVFGWQTGSHAARVAVIFAAFAEFNVLATALGIAWRHRQGKPVTTAFVLSTVLMWELLPGAFLLLPFAIFAPFYLLLMVLAVIGAACARYLIGRDEEFAGLITYLITAAFVVIACFYRPGQRPSSALSQRTSTAGSGVSQITSALAARTTETSSSGSIVPVGSPACLSRPESNGSLELLQWTRSMRPVIALTRSTTMARSSPAE